MGLGCGLDVKEGGIFVDQIFDFSEIEESGETIRKTWSEFRDALAKACLLLMKWKKQKDILF
jgi:hypothetical protein